MNKLQRLGLKLLGLSPEYYQIGRFGRTFRNINDKEIKIIESTLDIELKRNGDLANLVYGGDPINGGAFIVELIKHYKSPSRIAK